MENPQVDLKALNLRELAPNPEALVHGCTLGQEMMLDAFPLNSDTPNLNSDAPAPCSDAPGPNPDAPIQVQMPPIQTLMLLLLTQRPLV